MGNIATQILRKLSSALLISFLLFFLTCPLHAQLKLIKVEAEKLRAGQYARLTLIGSGFSKITNVDGVQIGDFEVEVLNPDRKSNTELILEIIVPEQIKPGVHDLIVQVSGPAFSTFLETHIRKSRAPDLRFLHGNKQIYNLQSTSIIFDSTFVNKPSKEEEFRIENRGGQTLYLKKLREPPGFISDGSFPDSVTAGNAAIFRVKLMAVSHGQYSGIIRFESNDSTESPFEIPVSGSVMPLSVAMPRPDLTIDGKPIITNKTVDLDFDTLEIGNPASRTITIRNKGTEEIIIDVPELPDILRITQTFPLIVQPGDSGLFKLNVVTDSAGKFQDSLVFVFNEPNLEPIRLSLSGTIADTSLPVTSNNIDGQENSTENEESVINIKPKDIFFGSDLPYNSQIFNKEDEEAGWAVIALYVIIGSIAGVGIVFGTKSILGSKVAKAGSTPQGQNVFQFKPVKDFGSQRTTQQERLIPEFEMHIKPVLDYGSAQIISSSPLLFENTEKDQRIDDLTQIEGIGPVISGLLFEEGIHTFSKLSNINSKYIKNILRRAKITMADPATWPEQANLAANSQWDDLQLLQSKLKGGREMHEAT